MNHKTHPIALPGSAEKKQESRDAQKVLRLFAKKLQPLGFNRTKPTFFTRPGKFVVEFVHVHKYTFGPKFRIHLGIRIRSDESANASLNGPSFDALPSQGTLSRSGGFDFEPGTEAIATCAETMAELVAAVGCEWFDAMRNPDLLRAAGQPLLRSFPMAELRRALNCTEEVVTSPATRAALNVD